MNIHFSFSRLRTVCAVLFAVSGFAASAQSQTGLPLAKTPSPKVQAMYGKLPLRFEQNEGQADASVAYVSRGKNYTVMLQPQAATLMLSRESVGSGKAAVSRTAMRMTLEGANAKAAMMPERELPGYVNYMMGGDRSKWHLGVPTYAATRASSVYPGIDVVYYGSERELEYDFVVAPQSDPSLIRLAIAGAKPVLEADGELRLQIGMTKRDTDVVFRKPVVYERGAEGRKAVDGAFTLTAKGEVCFKLGAYDRSKELVIDPVISYASYFGGPGEDEINGSAINASGQLYAVGQTLGTSLPNTSGEFQPNIAAGNNGHDAFVTKFSADGSTILWTTFLGGAADDFAESVAVNSSDQAYVVGYTESCAIGQVSNQSPGEFPFTTDAIQQLCSPNTEGFNNFESNGGGADAFLVKLSSDGKQELYGTPLGGSNDDYASSVVLDASGKVYIVGETTSTNYTICSSGASGCDVPSYPINNHNVADIGIADFPTTGNAFYRGDSESALNATLYPQGAPGIPAGSSRGPTDEQAFLTVLSADLHSFVYSSLIGGTGIGGCGNGDCNTNGLAVAVNTNGIVFIGGNTSSAHWPTTPGAFLAACSNAGAASSQCPMTGWLAAFDPTKSGAASLLFSTYVNGTSAGKDSNGNNLYPGSDVYGLGTDATGNVIATGDTGANNFPTTTGTLQPSCVLFPDGNGNTSRCTSAYVTKLSSAGATVWSTYYGPTTQNGGTVAGQGVALDVSGNVYVVGISGSPTLPLKNAFSTNTYSQQDAFLIELSPTGSSLLMGTYLGSGGGIVVNNNSLHLDSSLNAYFSGYQGYNNYGGTGFPISANAADKTLAGTDGWVVKIVTQPQVSTTALQITPNAGAPGTAISFTATVTGQTGMPTPTGTVALSNGSTSVGTITLTAGTGTFSSTTLVAGTYSVVGTYSGDAIYGSSASSAQTVAIQSTVTVGLTATPSTATLGTAVALVATVSAGTGTPTGTVYFMDGTSMLGSSVISGGMASYSATGLAVGTHSVTARYGGDSNFVTVTSAAQTVTIQAATPVVALTATPTSATVGTAIALAATVSSTAGTPTGTVSFLDGTTTLGSVTLSGGKASYSATALGVGTHSLTAKYSGDSSFAVVTSAVQTVTIQSAVPASVSAVANPASLTIKSGGSGTTTITVTPLGGYAGTITFACGTLPSAATCSFLPATLTFASSSSAVQSSTLTFSTVSQHAMLERPGSGRMGAGILAALMLLPMFAGRRARRNKGWISMSVMAFVAVILVSGVTGCSGTPQTTLSLTPAGTYTVPVTVSGGTATSTVTLQIVVQ